MKMNVPKLNCYFLWQYQLCPRQFFILLVQATPLSSTVKMSLKEDVPLVLDYKVGELGNLK